MATIPLHQDFFAQLYQAVDELSPFGANTEAMCAEISRVSRVFYSTPHEALTALSSLGRELRRLTIVADIDYDQTRIPAIFTTHLGQMAPSASSSLCQRPSQEAHKGSDIENVQKTIQWWEGILRQLATTELLERHLSTPVQQRIYAILQHYGQLCLQDLMQLERAVHESSSQTTAAASTSSQPPQPCLAAAAPSPVILADMELDGDGVTLPPRSVDVLPAVARRELPIVLPSDSDWDKENKPPAI